MLMFVFEMKKIILLKNLLKEKNTHKKYVYIFTCTLSVFILFIYLNSLIYLRSKNNIYITIFYNTKGGSL
jgi:hypothetical protein